MLYQKSKAKDIVADKNELRKLVLSTIDNMAQVVGRTLGPGGNPVLIEREDMPPLVTKDGVTVAKSLGVADSAANLIVDAAKEICINTAREAGDGTTTAIVLANALVKYGQQFLINNPKYNPQRIMRELRQAYDDVIVPYLKKVARKVETEEHLKQIATISANGDTELAEAVVEAVVASGDDGKVLIVEGQDDSIKVETVDGYVITSGLKDLGQIGPAFINDKAGQQVTMDNGYVVLYDGALNDLKLPGLIQDALTGPNGYTDNVPIIVMAHSFSDTVLERFAKTTKGGMLVIPVKTVRTGLPNGASMMLDDVAAYTGGRVYDPGNVDELSVDGFGRFDTARINMYESFIICEPDSDRITERINELKAIEKQAFSEMDKGHIRAAIAKLSGGIATIYVGGSSDLEIREKKARVEDAEEAVRSAIEEGIVPGGATIHLCLSRLLNQVKGRFPSHDILIEALNAPIQLLLENCGEDVDKVVDKLAFDEVDGAPYPTKVFDAYEHQLVCPFERGIIEPAKVIRVSIANALSVASLLTTLGGIVVAPRNAELEMQMELANQAFNNMLSAAQE